MKKPTAEKKETYEGSERRNFLRLSYKAPLMFKICKKKTFSKLMQGYTHDISQAGLKCNLQTKVPLNAILWLRLDMGALSMCEEIERRCTIVQHGILGKVVWTKEKKNESYDVGVCFVTREEKKFEDWFIKKPLESP